MFEPRANPAVVPLNDNEIVILGGYDESEFERKDIVVFSVKNRTCNKVYSGGHYRFKSSSNQTAFVENKVIALVDD